MKVPVLVHARDFFNPCPAPPTLTNISCIGDSITEGYNYGNSGYRVNQFHLGYTVRGKHYFTFVGSQTSTNPATVDGVSFSRSNDGYAGIRIQGLIDNGVPATVAALGPHIIQLMIGTNDVRDDLGNGADTRFATLLDQLIADCPNALVVVATITPASSGPSSIYTAQWYNRRICDVAAARAAIGKHVKIVDIYSTMLAGAISSTTVIAPFTQPAVNSSVSVSMGTTAWMSVNGKVFVGGSESEVTGGYYNCDSITDGTHAVLKNLGSSVAPFNNPFLAAGGTIPTGAFVSTGDEAWASNLFFDGLHPNNTGGYDLIGAAFDQVIGPYLAT